MTVFDDIVPVLTRIIQPQAEKLLAYRPLLINRDLNGRVRLIVDESLEHDQAARELFETIARQLERELGPHAYASAHAILWEGEDQSYQDGGVKFELDGCPNVFILDRQAVESDWANVRDIAEHPPRVVFYSVKGGVGRSTSLAAAAWQLAESGKRVLVFDMDLESPGLSSAILPENRRPKFGIADWLVEDLVNNGDALLRDMVATSPLSREGEVAVVAAHGAGIDEYLSKLGRVWMPKVAKDGQRQTWQLRLARLMDTLIEQHEPDIVLIDSRSGIDEVAAACLTGVGATQILLFAAGGEQTWNGYRMIFRYWRRTNAIRHVRERLQIVGAMIPESDRFAYLDGLRDDAWALFADEVYDEIPPAIGPGAEGLWNFDRSDATAPHFPRNVLWHRGLAGLPNLHGGLGDLSPAEITAVFGDVIETVVRLVGGFREAE